MDIVIKRIQYNMSRPVCAEHLANYYVRACIFKAHTSILFVTVLELTAPSRRTVAMAMRVMFWPSGCVSLSLIAYYIKDWNWLQLAITVPACFHLLIIVLQVYFYTVTCAKKQTASGLFYAQFIHGYYSTNHLIDNG